MNNVLSGKVTLILPVRKAGSEVRRCLRSILAGTVVPAEIFVMDCTAEPGALEPVIKEFHKESDKGFKEKFGKAVPRIRIFDFGRNPGRAHAVNTGIHLVRTPYVMTFSPRLIAGKHCVERLCRALDEDGNLMSVQAGILSSDDPTRISGAGWILAFGARPVKRGEGEKASPFLKRAKITAAQMEAAVYRMEHLEVTGILDERYYGRLEDLDLGYRGILCGFYNLYEPAAVCKVQTACLSDSDKKERFYRHLEAGNMVYFRYKFGKEGTLEKFRGLFSASGGEPGNSAFQKFRGFFGVSGKVPEDEAAVERGRMLCFMAEMERMEREELGVSVTKQTLPEECCLSVKDEGLMNVYPLYLGERTASPLRNAWDSFADHCRDFWEDFSYSFEKS